MDSKKSPKISTEFGQRIRLHTIFCELHMDSEMLNSFIEHFHQLNFVYCKERPQEIHQELQYSKYLQYTTILIIIQTECKCGTLILRKVLKNLKLNRYIRYKTKFIFCKYPDRHLEYPRRCPVDHNGRKSMPRLCCDNVSETQRLCLRTFTEENEILTSLNTDRVQRDIDIFGDANIDNIFFVQNYSKYHHNLPRHISFVLRMLVLFPEFSLNEALRHEEFGSSVHHSTAKANLYLHSINPALAIIINNYYFTTNHEMREGSEQDVRRLMREFKIAQIPFVLIQDSGREELLQLLEYIRRKNFRPLKSFLFFIMSHGGANNVIYTNDGQLDLIEDIVQRIQSNKSLNEAKKFIIIISCRGTIDMVYADRSDLNKIRNANNNSYSLDDNTVILRSVPELVMSPRDPEWGTPFIRSFCQRFRYIDHTQGIRIVHNRIESDLQMEPYYEYLKKRSDLIVGNEASVSNCLIQPRVKTKRMLKLIKSIRNDFSSFHCRTAMRNTDTQGDGDRQFRSLFYVCGSVKEIDDPSGMSFVDIYFSPDLDKDKEDDDVQG